MAISDALDELWELLQYPWDPLKADTWCDKLEDYWTQEQRCGGESKTAQEPDLFENRLIQVSARLRFLLLQCLQGVSIRDAEEGASPVLENPRGSHSDELMSKAMLSLNDSERNTSFNSVELRAILRICKNFLRWYLQIYNTVSYGCPNKSKDPIPEWKSLKMLQLYISITEQNTTSDAVLAQHASQILFYSSYNPISGSDDGLLGSYMQLLEEDAILMKLLNCLVHAFSSIPLTLSIIRNLHNIMVSFPKGVENATKAEVSTEPPTSAVSWIPQDGGIITFKIALPLIALWALEQEPPFPGDTDDKRAELVMEIERACYVMRMGSDLVSSKDGPFARMVLALLRLDPAQPNCDACRRESIPLLMDVAGEVSDFLVAEDVVQYLLAIMEAQVSEVHGKTLVNDAAAAALTPILVVLHKLCSSNEDIRKVTKVFIFPLESEELFQEKKREEIENHGKIRNMSPLDAPNGTLRWKLIQLLTWPQSHIKRFTGELLWVLCENEAQEFIARTGMGNAVIILGARGLVQLPGNITG